MTGRLGMSIALALAALLLVAGAGLAAIDEKTVDVKESGCSDGRVWCFDQDALATTGGMTVQVSLMNSGQIPHSWCVRIGETEHCTENPTAGTGPGAESVVEFPTPSEGGVFAYYCKVPGHREAGMIGNLTVQEGGDAVITGSPSPPPTSPPPSSPPSSPPPSPPPSSPPPSNGEQPRGAPFVGMVSILAGVGVLAVALRRR